MKTDKLGIITAYIEVRVPYPASRKGICPGPLSTWYLFPNPEGLAYTLKNLHWLKVGLTRARDWGKEEA